MKRSGILTVAIWIIVGCALSSLWTMPGYCQGPVPVANPGFEGRAWKTNAVGTSLSSWLAVDWVPWSVLGDTTHNREVEYKLITLETGSTPDLRSHVHSGTHAQQFFTNAGSHTAGFYQRVRVPANSQVTFSIWVQIQTGDKLLFVDGRFVSDLKGVGGNYYVQVGIDPTGAMPAQFAAPLPATIVWSAPLWDITAHGTDASGNPADLWVPISVSSQARGEWISIYTRGQCKYPTKYNTSFWDDASVVATQPPTPTRPPATPTPRPKPTSTPAPTATPTATWTPTATPEPTQTPLPTATPSPTALPTNTPVPTATPSAVPTATPIALAVAVVPSPTAGQPVSLTPAPATAAPPVARTSVWDYVGLGAAIVAALVVGLLLGRWLGRRG